MTSSDRVSSDAAICGRGTTHDQDVYHARRRPPGRREDERDQLVPVRVDPEHADPPLVVAHPGQHPARLGEPRTRCTTKTTSTRYASASQ